MKNGNDSNPDQSGQVPSGSAAHRRVHVFVSGRVQGVFFRAETQHQASRLGLTGWVRNLEDRRVETVFEGGKDAVANMLDWCKKGPALSRVTGVEFAEEPPAGDFDDFRIRY